MNVENLVHKISSEFGFSKALSDRIFKFIIQQVKLELRNGLRVRFRNFGSFISKISHGKKRAIFDDSKNFFT